MSPRMSFDHWRPRVISARVFAEGSPLPKGYGVAWWLPYSHAAYCLPVPLNRIVGSFRNWYLAWRRPCEDDPVMDVYGYAYEQGRACGACEGEERAARLYDVLLREVKTEIRDIRRTLH